MTIFSPKNYLQNKQPLLVLTCVSKTPRGAHATSWTGFECGATGACAVDTSWSLKVKEVPMAKSRLIFNAPFNWKSRDPCRNWPLVFDPALQSLFATCKLPTLLSLFHLFYSPEKPPLEMSVYIHKKVTSICNTQASIGWRSNTLYMIG